MFIYFFFFIIKIVLNIFDRNCDLFISSKILLCIFFKRENCVRIIMVFEDLRKFCLVGYLC